MRVTGRFVLRIHAAFLMLLTTVMVIAGFVGLSTGAGPLYYMNIFPMAYVGQVQAYLLMFFIGVCLWIASGGTHLWRWNAIAIAAHAVPLFAIFSMWNVLADAELLSVTIYSYIIHGTWIAVEAVSLIQNLIKGRLAASAPSGA